MSGVAPDPQSRVAEELPYLDHVIVPRVFDADQCRRIIEVGVAAGTSPAALESGAEDGSCEHDPPRLDDSIRSSSVSWIERSPSTEWVFSTLEDTARKVNQRYGFELTGIEEDVQFTAYDRPGAFYTWHQDGLDVGVSRRKLSLVVQLSSPRDYEGATLEFFALTEDGTDRERAAAARAMSGRGTAIAFPAFEYHRVTPLRSGVRHSLVVWVAGPPFR